MALTEITSKSIKDGEIVNADVNASAAIAKSKLAGLDIVNADINASAAIAGSKLAAATTSAAGSMSAADKTKLDGIATSANAYVHPNHTGDVTSTADGATVIAAGAVDIAMLANGTDGQIITWDASGAPTVVGPGTDGQVLTSTGAGSPPAFEDAAGGVAGISSSADATAITIDSSERVMIGTTTPGYTAGDDLTIQPPSGSGGITIRTGTSDSGKIYFSRGTSGGDQYKGTITYNHADDTLAFASPNGDALTVETDRNVTIEAGNLIIGTSGKGIDFSATADADAGGETISNVDEVLDDYEEGRWTPTLMYSGAANCTTNAYSPKGRYVKVGQLVFVSGYIALTAKGSDNGSGTLEIHGLPFSSDQYGQPDRPAYSGYSGYFENFSVTEIAIIWGNNNDKCYITGNVDDNNQILSYSHLTDTSWLAFSMTYRAGA